jgi:hypothetical protein
MQGSILAAVSRAVKPTDVGERVALGTARAEGFWALAIMGVLDAVELVLVLVLLPATLEVVNIDSCCISQSLWPGTSWPDLSPILFIPFLPPTLSPDLFSLAAIDYKPLRSSKVIWPRVVPSTPSSAVLPFVICPRACQRHHRLPSCRYECPVPISCGCTFVRPRCIQMAERSLPPYARGRSKTSRTLE